MIRYMQLYCIPPYSCTVYLHCKKCIPPIQLHCIVYTCTVKSVYPPYRITPHSGTPITLCEISRVSLCTQQSDRGQEPSLLAEILNFCKSCSIHFLKVIGVSECGLIQYYYIYFVILILVVSVKLVL